MEVEARGIEGPIIVMAVGGFEVTGGVEFGGIPETTAKVGEKREVGP